mmetsp:Transcript_120068/g.224461  ORF Transcript_120068/g.224461 Transcript_120068/m.224461 type:complete len:339 (-) Transcript_120068:71-1087(-)
MPEASPRPRLSHQAVAERRAGKKWRLKRLKRQARAHRRRRRRHASQAPTSAAAGESDLALPDAKRRRIVESDEKVSAQALPPEALRKVLPENRIMNTGQGEASREEVGLKLLGELAPANASWTYPLADDEWRCYAGYLPGALAKPAADRFFDLIKTGTRWLQPSGRWGPLPLKTAWIAQAPCSCTYRYGGAEVAPDNFPQWMEEVLSVCMPLCGLHAREAWPNSCNLNLYVDGQHSVGWHADNESLFQGKVRDMRVISLSLGQSRKFELRCGKAFHRLNLDSGDLCTMEGLTQKHFLHRVPKENGCKRPRINLTWRWIVEHLPGCVCAKARSAAASAA